MHQNATERKQSARTGVRGARRVATAVVALLAAVLLVAAPAAAQDDGSGAYVGSDTTILPDEGDTAVASAEVEFPQSAPPASAATSSAAVPSGTLPFTGGDAAQLAVLGAVLLLGGLGLVAWRRRTAAA